MQLTPSPTLSVGGHPPPHPFPAWLHTPRAGVHVAHTVRNALSEEGAGAGGRGPGSSQSEGAGVWSLHPRAVEEWTTPHSAHGGGR